MLNFNVSKCVVYYIFLLLVQNYDSVICKVYFIRVTKVFELFSFNDLDEKVVLAVNTIYICIIIHKGIYTSMGYTDVDICMYI